MASGRTWLGLVPALNTSKRSPASWRNRPSAIWLRAEFPVQRMRTRFLSGMSTIGFGERDYNFVRFFGERWDEPAEECRCGSSACELGNDKSGRVSRTDTG